MAACILRGPVWGVIGYYVTYIISPATRWWGAPLAGLGFRFSYFMAAAAVVGLVLHFKNLKSPKGISRQEVLLWIFIASIWMSAWMNPPIVPGEDLALKLTKAAVMIFVLKRSVDDFSKYRWVIWALLLASAYGAFDTRLLASRIGSRIQSGVGGSDFMEGNFLAAHLCMMLPFLGALFLMNGWKIRVFLGGAAAVIVDMIIQCRSRGAFVALIAGCLTAFIFAPPGTRRRIYPLLLIAAIGAFSLVDVGFLGRMSQLNPIGMSEEWDQSASGRLLAWKAALSMSKDHPLGVGVNNFKARVEEYESSIPGKDTHNTYLRCMAELGIQGFTVLILLIGTAFLKAYKLHRDREHEFAEYRLMAWATEVALVIYVTAGMFISLTYIEDFYLILMLPDVLSKIRRTEEGIGVEPLLEKFPTLRVRG